MKQMRAALFDSYGPPTVLYTGNVPIPAIGDDDVLVRVEANSINGGEVLLRAGRISLLSRGSFPRRIGIDFVGEISAAGRSVSRLQIGDRVWGTIDEAHGFGAAAEYVAATLRTVALAPRNLTPVEAVSLLAGGTTAITGLRDHANLQPRERLLVRGASGGVGSIAVQIGALMGAEVTGLASDRSADFVRSLGAAHVLDYATTTPADLGTFDVIFDTQCTQFAGYHRRLAPRGRMVAIAFDLKQPVRSLGYIAGSTIFGKSRVRFFRGRPTSGLFDELTRYAEQGLIRPVVHATFPLAQIASAHSALEAGGVLGKVVVQVAD